VKHLRGHSLIDFRVIGGFNRRRVSPSDTKWRMIAFFDATHQLADRYDIRTVQELLGHNGVRTTMIYTHVLNRGGRDVRNPADVLTHRPHERSAETAYHARKRCASYLSNEYNSSCNNWLSARYAATIQPTGNTRISLNTSSAA
jgi:hypothetical protein